MKPSSVLKQRIAAGGLIPGTAEVAYLDGCHHLLKLSPKLPSTLRKTSSLLDMQSIRRDTGERLLGQARDAEPLTPPKTLPSRIPIPELSGILLKPIHTLFWFRIFFWSRCSRN